MPKHKEIPYTEIHDVGYIQNVDPGAIGTGRAWIDTTTNPAKLYVRNDADTSWWDMNVTFQVAADSDTAPSDDTTAKKVTLQKLAAPPTSAAYVEFVNNPGTEKFYFVLEEA